MQFDLYVCNKKACPKCHKECRMTLRRQFAEIFDDGDGQYIKKCTVLPGGEIVEEKEWLN